MTVPGLLDSDVIARRETCRGCGGTQLDMFLSLGTVPLANAFLPAPDLPELRFPLEVYFCSDCSLVQLLHVVRPDVLFSNYLYRTGTNRTIARHNAALAESVIQELGLGSRDLVVEVASNDGSLLQCFRERGLRTLGVEPAKNIARLARDSGIETVEEFFDARLAASLSRAYGPAAAVLANNVLAHVDSTQDFLSACASLLRPGGMAIIEVPYLAEMLARLEYDTIYHEHLCYFSISALTRLFGSARLALERSDEVEIHGGSLRLWGRPSHEPAPSDSVRQQAQREGSSGLTQLATFVEFARRVEAHRNKLLALLQDLKAQGRSIVGYGAPAKGNTLLCYCGIGREFLPYTVDRSALKVGLYTPGTHIPVAPVEQLLRDQPDYVLILAWNFADEIIASLHDYQERGGRFILPIPEPRII